MYEAGRSRTLNFNSIMLMTAMFLDIEKAFNTTWQSGLLLIHKLSELEFLVSRIELILSSLAEKKFEALVEGKFSMTKK
jgi:hypothetical protein